MRKWWVPLAVLLLGLGVAFVRPSGCGETAETAHPEALALPTFDAAPVAVQSDDGREGLTLSGRVLDSTGRVIPGAQVHLASSLQQSLATAKCGDCGLSLLACPARETVPRVVELLQRRQGLLTPALSTTTDEAGRFKFERLKGVDFSVWAAASGLGAAVRERAAPGEPIDLYLPPLRALTGEVVDERGVKVNGAHVHAVSNRLPLSREAKVDGSGQFRVEGLGEGPFTVFASAPGYLPVALNAVEAGPQKVRLTLVAPRVLEVTVVDRGAPADATLELLGDHLSRRLTTENGAARIEALYPDFLVVSASDGRRSSEPKSLTLTDPVTRVELELTAGGRILVTTVDDEGQPVPAPEIVLLTQSGTVVARAKTATGELAIFGPMAAGDYLVEASAEGFKPNVLPVSVRESEVNVELPLTRAITLSGRVLDVYGRPAPRISVLVQPTGESVYADEEGRFSVPVPTVGLYTLLAHHSDWGGGETKTNAPASGVELHLEPKGQVEVTVQADGRRVEGAHLTMWIERDGVFRSDRPSGPDGVVPMRGMPPGTYWLVANHSDFLSSERQRVTVEEGEIVRLQVSLKAGAGLRGEVVDVQGKPISGAVVTVIPRGVEPALTDAEGRFALKTLRPGRTYRVEARHAHYDQEVEVEAIPGETPVKVVLKGRELFRGRVLARSGEPIKRYRIDEHEVASADGRFELPLRTASDRVIFGIEALGYEPQIIDRPPTPELGDFLLESAPRITGRVVQAGSGPIADAVVTCDVCEESVLTDADGAFALSAPAFVSRFGLMARKGALTATREIVKSGRGPYELTLQQATKLSGTVYGIDGKPRAGVEVAGVSQDRSEPVVVVTNADGTYSTELPPGLYRFSMGARPEFSGEPWLVVQIAGAQMHLDLGNPPGSASLALELKPERGKALWVVRGEVREVANPPGDSLRPDWALMMYQPRATQVVLPGLAPGRYTVIYANYYVPADEGPTVRTVDVRGATSLSLLP